MWTNVTDRPAPVTDGPDVTDITWNATGHSGTTGTHHTATVSGRVRDEWPNHGKPSSVIREGSVRGPNHGSRAHPPVPRHRAVPRVYVTDVDGRLVPNTTGGDRERNAEATPQGRVRRTATVITMGNGSRNTVDCTALSTLLLRRGGEGQGIPSRHPWSRSLPAPPVLSVRGP